MLERGPEDSPPEWLGDDQRPVDLGRDLGWPTLIFALPATVVLFAGSLPAGARLFILLGWFALSMWIGIAAYRARSRDVIELRIENLDAGTVLAILTRDGNTRTVLLAAVDTVEVNRNKSRSSEILEIRVSTGGKVYKSKRGSGPDRLIAVLDAAGVHVKTSYSTDSD